MKSKALKAILHIWLLGTFLFLGSCSDDEASFSQAFLNLTKTWEIENVTLNSFDVTSPSYENFAILFRPDNSYFAVDADPAFTESGGFWEFIDGDPSRITMGDVSPIEVNISFNQDATTLTMTFTANGEEIGSGNRLEGLEGDYIFNLRVSDQELE